MDVPELLESVGLLVPEATATGNDLTVRDVWDHLVHDEWDTALDLLQELGDGRPPPLTFWEAMAGAAGQLRMERSAAWCHWRCAEIRKGVIRADLTLRPARYRAVEAGDRQEAARMAVAMGIHQRQAH